MRGNDVAAAFVRDNARQDVIDTFPLRNEPRDAFVQSRASFNQLGGLGGVAPRVHQHDPRVLQRQSEGVLDRARFRGCVGATLE